MYPSPRLVHFSPKSGFWCPLFHKQSPCLSSLSNLILLSVFMTRTADIMTVGVVCITYRVCVPDECFLTIFKLISAMPMTFPFADGTQLSYFPLARASSYVSTLNKTFIFYITNNILYTIIRLLISFLLCSHTYSSSLTFLLQPNFVSIYSTEYAMFLMQTLVFV